MPFQDAEKRRAYHREYQRKNRDRLAATKSAYYQRTKEHVREKTKAWFATHPGAQQQMHIRSRMRKPWAHLIRAAKARAKKKNIPFSLTLEWGRDKWTGKCALTDLPFSVGLSGSGPKHRSGSIDRIDSSLGYTPDNCRFILACINNFKHDGTDEDMLEVAQALVKSKMHPLLYP